MKSERRHQMQQNELAEVLGTGINSVAPYARAALFGIIGIVVIAFVYTFISTQKEAHRSTASLDFLLATNNEDPESFNRVSNEYGDTQPGQWAQQAQADLNLAQGIEALFIDRNEAKGFIDAAVNEYQSIIASARDPLLKSRANFGLAKAYETRGEIDAAVAAYQAVASLTKSETLKQQVETRIETLGSADAKEFYAWFQENLPESSTNETPTVPGLDSIPSSPLDGLPEVKTPSDIVVTDAQDGGASTEPKKDTSADPSKEDTPVDPAKDETPLEPQEQERDASADGVTKDGDSAPEQE